ncbi:MAG: beta strand repeat-containing protein [Candidatus Dormibacteria bacterium]
MYRLATRAPRRLTAILLVLAAGATSLGLAGHTALAASPMVTGISPSAGPAAGGATVTINGSGLTGATSAQFGPAIGSSLTVLNDTQATVVSPPMVAGTYPLTVTTAGGTSAVVTAGSFTVGLPAVTGVSPPSGPANTSTTVTITGSGFTGATSVTFGSTVVTSPTVVSDTSITVSGPALPQQILDVRVNTPAGQSLAIPADRYTYGPAYIAGFSPLGGPVAGGTVVTVTGTGFSNVTAVLFGGTVAVPSGTSGNALAAGTNIVQDPTGNSVTVTTPGHVPGGALITVVTNGGTASTAALSPSPQFMFYDGNGPVINSLNTGAASISGGTLVVVNATNLDPTAINNQVYFGGALGLSVTITPPNPLQPALSQNLTVIAPAHAAGSVPVTLQIGSAVATAPKPVTFVNPTGPVVTGVTVTTNSSQPHGATGGHLVAGSLGAVSSAPFETCCQTPVGGSAIVQRPHTCCSGLDFMTDFGTGTPYAAGINGPSNPIGPLVTITGSGFANAIAVKLAAQPGSGTSFASIPMVPGAPVSTYTGLSTAGFGEIQGFSIIDDSDLTFYAPQWASGNPIFPHVQVISVLNPVTAPGTTISSTIGSGLSPDALRYTPVVMQGFGGINWSPTTASSVQNTLGLMTVPGDGFDKANPANNSVTFTPAGGGGQPVTVAGTLLPPAGCSATAAGGPGGTTYSYAIVGTTPQTTGVATSSTGDTMPSPTCTTTGGAGVAVTVTATGLSQGAVSYKLLRASGASFSVVETGAGCPPQAALTPSVVNGNVTFVDPNAAPACAQPYTPATANPVPFLLAGGLLASDQTLTFGRPLMQANVIDVQVTNDVGTSPLGCPDEFLFLGDSFFPEVSSFSLTATNPMDPNHSTAPASSTTGESVTVTGSGFNTGAGGIQLFFGPGTTPFTTLTPASSTSFTFTTPSRPAGLTDLLVQNAGADLSPTWCRDTINFASAPVIAAVFPRSGPSGGASGTAAIMTITGQNFIGNNATNNSIGVFLTAQAGGSTLSTLITAPSLVVNPAGTQITFPLPDLAQSSPPSTWTAQVQAMGLLSNIAPSTSYVPQNGMTGLTVSPVTAPSQGGQPLSIQSSAGGFMTPDGKSAVSGVFIAGAACNNVVTLSDSTISCNSPAMAPPLGGGVVDIQIRSPFFSVDGTPTFSVGAGLLTITGQTPTTPTVTSVSPNAGPQDTPITNVVINGTGFGQGDEVWFGGVPATYVTVNNSSPGQGQITATAPAQSGSVGTVPVQVGQGSLLSPVTPGVSFNYESQQQPPILYSASPAGGPANGTVAGIVLLGKNFTSVDFSPSSNPIVYFGNTPAASVKYINDRMLVVTAPAGLTGSVPVTVATQAGTSGAVQFTYQGAPTVTGISPAAGPSGQMVNLTGTNLLGAIYVQVGVATTAPTSDTATAITFVAPPQIIGTNVPVNVTTASGTSFQMLYDYNYTPSLTPPPPAGNPPGNPPPPPVVPPAPPPGLNNPPVCPGPELLAKAINDAFQDELNRPVDAPSLCNDMQFVAAGGAPLIVFQGITHSPEAEALRINSYYMNLLGRPADPSGLTYGLSLYESGRTDEEMQASFLAATEYASRTTPSPEEWLHGHVIDQLFQEFDGRPATPFEISTFDADLAMGANLSDIGLGIMSSTEYRTNLVRGFYTNLLNRPVDPTGLAANLAAMQMGTSDEDIQANIMASDEYFAGSPGS